MAAPKSFILRLGTKLLDVTTISFLNFFFLKLNRKVWLNCEATYYIVFKKSSMGLLIKKYPLTIENND